MSTAERSGDHRSTERALSRIDEVEGQIESLDYIAAEARKVMIGGTTFAIGSALMLLGLVVREVAAGASVNLAAYSEWLLLLSGCLVTSLILGIGGWFQVRHYRQRIERMEEDLALSTGAAGRSLGATDDQTGTP